MDGETYLARKRELDLRYCDGEADRRWVRPEYAWVGCPFCGPGVRTETYMLPALARGLTLVRCVACGLVYAEPRLSREALDERATNALHFQYYQDSFTGPPDPSSAAPEVEFIRRTMGAAWRPNLRALEVGCAGGVFLAALAAAGVQATGVDANEASVAQCRRYGLDARVGFFRDDEFTMESYDVIVFRESLYMLFDVRAVLALARRLLAPGGLLYVRVFDVESAAFQLSTRAAAGINMLDVPVAFSRASVERVLQTAGFQVVARTSASDPLLADLALGPATGKSSVVRRIIARAGSELLSVLGRTRNFIVIAQREK
jgi:SAM-dependent methyltransferase